MDYIVVARLRVSADNPQEAQNLAQAIISIGTRDSSYDLVRLLAIEPAKPMEPDGKCPLCLRDASQGACNAAPCGMLDLADMARRTLMAGFTS